MQTPRCILAAILAFASCGLFAAVKAPFANPGFENGFDAWVVGSTDGGMSQLAGEAAYSGVQGVKVTDASPTAGSSVYSARFPVVAGNGYELAFQARLLAGEGVGVYLLFYDEHGALAVPSGQFVRSLRQVADWKRFTLPATAPAGAVEAAVWIHSYDASTVTAHFDDFELFEVLANPGFEDAFAGWTVPSIDGGMSSVAAGAARTGASGLRVVDTSTTTGSSVYSRRLPAVPGAGYELSFWSRLTTGQGIGVYVLFYDEHGALAVPSNSFVLSLREVSGWRRSTLRAVAPANAASMAIWIHSYDQATATADFDDFSLVQSDALFSSGFENGLDDWLLGATDGGMSQALAVAARSGDLGLRITDSSAGGGSDLYSPKIPVRQGQAHELDFWARVITGGGVGVYLRYYDAANLLLSGSGAHLTVPADQVTWGRFTLAHVAPAGATHVSIWLHSYAANSVTVDFDDVRLREIPRSFVETFPKASPDRRFGELKVRQTNGAVYRTPVDDWTGAAQRATASPWLSWVTSQKADVDQWMTTHADNIAWKAGWWHDFVSPVDGAFLVWSDSPPLIGSTIPSQSGYSVTVTQKIFDAWVFRFRSLHMERIQDAARLYRLTGDATYADWAAGQLDFYATNRLLWPEHSDKGHPARLFLQSLDEAVNLIRLVEAARLLFDYVGAVRRNDWHVNLFKPEAELLDRSFQSIHNIATWLRSAQAQVALLYDDDALWRRAVDGPYGLRAQLRLGVSGDYIWHEQSMGYNDYVVNATSRLLTFAGLLGRGRELEHEAAIIQNLVLAPLTFRFPDNRLPNPADSNSTITVPSGWLRDIYRVLPTRIGLNAAASRRNWDTLLDPVVTEGPSVLPVVVSTHLESTRFALMARNSWQVFFHYGQLHSSHSQHEALNWSATFEGVSITMDPGTVGYGSSLHGDYFRRGLNHNVPLVGGEGQTRWQRGELLAFNPATGVMTGEQLDYQLATGAAARRTLRIENDGRLVDEATVVLDSGVGKLGLALHLQGTPTLPGSFLPVTNFATGRPAAFGYWQDVRAAAFYDQAEIDVTFAHGLVLRVKFSVPGAFTVYQGSSPDLPAPARRAGFYIEKQGDAAEATFVTEFLPLIAD